MGRSAWIPNRVAVRSSKVQSLSARRAVSIAVVAGLCFLYLYTTHYKLLTLPYFWDEAGQFISQAHDLHLGEGLIPRSTLPNSHPPGLPLLLAGVWKVAGESIAVTRVVMLAWGTAYLTLGFLLAIELLKQARGAPAFMALAMLGLNPLVFTQSMMAQLDLPAAVFTTLLLLGWVRRDEGMMLAGAIGGVCFKETSLAVAWALAWWAWREGRKTLASQLFLAPGLIVLNWVGYVWWSTGKLLGDTAYAEYNMLYPLHPVRLLYALARRVSYLGLENLHVVGAGVLAWKWREVGFGPAWKPVVAGCLALVGLVSVTGGAVLERYLLPVLPVLYAAFAAGFSRLAGWRKHLAVGLSCTGLLGMLFANPPWPYPLENNLAMVDLVQLHKDVAGYLAGRLSRSRITTAWPLTDALRKPYLGYVEEALPDVRPIEDFSLERLKGLDWRKGDVLVVYSRSWNPDSSFARWPWVRQLLRTFFRQADEMGPLDIGEVPGLVPLVGFSQRGFWVEILIVP